VLAQELLDDPSPVLIEAAKNVRAELDHVQELDSFKQKQSV
tara:strand:- start:388 stop:510 length:123 start_codon:yes stop_codon:yes gene_type:complete